MRIRDLVQRFGGTCSDDAALEIDVLGITAIELAGPGHATFASDDQRLAAAENTPAACVIVPTTARASAKTLIRVDLPNRFAADLMAFFHPEQPAAAGVHPSAVIGDGTTIADTASIGPHVTLGAGCRVGQRARLMPSVVIGDGCEIGDDSVIHANVTLYPRTKIGARVLIHAGAVIGADGFGFFPDGGGLRKWPHVGNVVIEDDVEIGANACVDRAKFGTTLIQRGAKIDNLVQIAHNCRVGRFVVIAGQAGLSGSVTLEDGVALGGQVGVADHVTVGRGAQLAAQAGVMTDVPAGGTYVGAPARPVRQFFQEISIVQFLAKHHAALKKLLRGSDPPGVS